jgi:hypothetical protein
LNDNIERVIRTTSTDAVTLRSFLAAGHCAGGLFVPDLLGNRGGGGFDNSKSSRHNWRQFLPNCQARLAKF